MALSQTPPPLFKQGLPARLRLLIAVSASVAMIYVDLHFGVLKPLRQGLQTVLFPVVSLLSAPRDLFLWAGNRLDATFNILDREAVLAQRETQTAEAALLIEQLERENIALRALLELRPAARHKTLAAEISHQSRDVFGKRVVIDRGSQHGVAVGHPVINSKGVVGQVVRVSPITSEVSLLNDPALTIPVSFSRTGVRTLASGDGQRLVLKYLHIDADVEVGDLLVTSGLDGIYPSGLPVAVVDRIERTTGQFARAMATPSAPVAPARQVVVILVDESLIPPAPRELGSRQLGASPKGSK
jgi:rod shape-determining protein MreC